MSRKATGYPREIDLDGDTVTLRLMTAADEAGLNKFAKRLPPHDLLFLRRDITNRKVVAAWVTAVEDGSIKTVLAVSNDEIVGCAALIRDPLSWSPHLGEVRVLVAESARQKGLGRELIQEVFQLALERDLKKLTAHMTVDQKGAIAVFEELGFRGEALLKDQVLDKDGEAHDIVILACNPDRAGNFLSAYGRGDSD